MGLLIGYRTHSYGCPRIARKDNLTSSGQDRSEPRSGVCAELLVSFVSSPASTVSHQLPREAPVGRPGSDLRKIPCPWGTEKSFSPPRGVSRPAATAGARLHWQPKGAHRLENFKPESGHSRQRQESCFARIDPDPDDRLFANVPTGAGSHEAALGTTAKPLMTSTKPIRSRGGLHRGESF